MSLNILGMTSFIKWLKKDIEFWLLYRQRGSRFKTTMETKKERNGYSDNINSNGGFQKLLD